jgi:hypothetical protein
VERTCPDLWRVSGSISEQLGSGRVCTSLGEESAEAMVVVLGLALLGQVAVGLDAVLEAVELRPC